MWKNFTVYSRALDYVKQNKLNRFDCKQSYNCCTMSTRLHYIVFYLNKCLSVKSKSTTFIYLGRKKKKDQLIDTKMYENIGKKFSTISNNVVCYCERICGVRNRRLIYMYIVLSINLLNTIVLQYIKIFILLKVSCYRLKYDSRMNIYT